MGTDETGTARTTETAARIVGRLTRDEKVELCPAPASGTPRGCPTMACPP
jgi:hypothetical protein